jgi:hypothetical protein
MCRISFRLAVPVTFAALTVWPVEDKAQQHAAAAILLPEFIEVPQLKIIRALG